MTQEVDQSQFRAAMAQLGAAVNIITTDGPAGRHGITASAVCSVTDAPATLLVCINRASRMHDIAKDNGLLAVNVLGGGHEALCGLFASNKLSSEERFATGEWRAMDNGVPGLADALVTFSCRIDKVQDVGTHGIFICRVEQLVAQNSGDALVYYGRAFHRLSITQS